MEHAPTPIFATAMSMQRLEEARADYLAKREVLKEQHQAFLDLRKTLNSHRGQAEAANREAEAAIRAAKGQETDEIVELQEMGIRKERQIQTVERMIAELEPLVEFHQIEAYGARGGYVRCLKMARQSAGHDALQEEALTLFRSEAATPFLRTLPGLMQRVEESFYNDSLYMAQYGLDLGGFGGHTSPDHVRAHLSSESQAAADHEVTQRKLMAIGEIVVQFIEDSDGDALADAGELLQPIEMLDCEETGAKWKGSTFGIARRRRELVGQLGEQAA